MKKLILTLATIYSCSVNAQPCFSPATSYTLFAAYCPASIISTDFNGDGQVDLAIANDSIHLVSVLLGSGSGIFGPASSYTVDPGAISVTSGDFNGDGNADLATANCGYYPTWAHSASVMLGTGTGSFGAFSSFPVDSVPYCIICADFNKDGNLDLATANAGSDNISILLGTGTGSFGGTTNYSVALNSYPVSIVTADFNGDGSLDLATANWLSNDVSVLLGSGTGTFSGAATFTADSMPRSITSADFNGDSKADLAVANSVGKNISILLGTGNGSFSSAVNYTVGISSMTHPNSIISSNFDGDGKLDLATANLYNPGILSVLLGTGTGTFGTVSSFTVGCGSSAVCSGDFDGNGMPDLASANYCSYNASVILNCTPTPTCIASVTDSLFNISPLNWGIVPNYSSQVTSAVWYWGDGTSTPGLYLSHTYTTAGWYNICVTVYTSCGDSASKCRNDSIYRVVGSQAMINVNVVSSTEINEKAVGQWSVYPNPANNFLMVESGAAINDIELFDLVGRSVKRQRTGKNSQIDISDLSSGLYLVQIRSGKVIYCKKVLKQ